MRLRWLALVLLGAACQAEGASAPPDLRPAPIALPVTDLGAVLQLLCPDGGSCAPCDGGCADGGAR